jgi:acetate---CoA ligase (ADP-forming)
MSAADAVLSPRSVAVIGASPDPTKRGHQIVRALLDDGYRGAIHPVSPRGGTLLGLPVARDVRELPHGVDLALIATPAATVPGLLDACGEAGVAAAVVLALGFGESGGDGARLEAELRAAIARSGVRVVGPNTSGIANPWLGLNLIGVRGLRPGGLAVVAQSGNVLLGMLLESLRRPAVGMSCCIGVGNATDLGVADYLSWLADDDRTRAIALYAEGLGSGRRFLDAAAKAVARRPVVMLKGGRSREGGTAARSHTGALSGDHAVLRAALREIGVVEVERSDELFPLVETLLTQPPGVADAGLAVLSDAGGHATLAADQLAALGTRAAAPSGATRTRLRARLGDAAATANPVDLAGAADRDPAALADAAQALLDDADTGALLVVGLFGGYALRFAAELEEAEVAASRRLAELARGAGKPLVVHSLYADAASRALDVLRAEGVPVCASLEVACRCAAGALRRPAEAARAAGRLVRLGGSDAPHINAPAAAVVTLEPELRVLLGGYDVPVAAAEFCADAGAVAAAAALAVGPLAVRAVAAGVPHRTEAGGVRLNVPPADAVVVYEEMRSAVESYARGTGVDAAFAGVLLGPMLAPPVAELLVGVRADDVFGRVLAIGAGGTAVEVLRDVVLRVPPLDREDVFGMLDELRIAPLLRGWRGRPAADREAIAAVALGLLACAEAHPALGEIELNPLFAYPDGAVAVDVRAFAAAPVAEPATW